MRSNQWLIALPGSLLVGGAAAQEPPAQANRSPVLTRADADFRREAYALKAEQSVRLDRCGAIGEKCLSLSDEDSATIRRRSREMLETYAADVHERDHEWAHGYLRGLRVGALCVVDLADAIDSAGCKRFARPGGPLMRIMTWTDKPQHTPEGLRASPHRMP